METSGQVNSIVFSGLMYMFRTGVVCGVFCRADTMSAPRIPRMVRQHLRRAGRFCLEIRLARVPGKSGAERQGRSFGAGDATRMWRRMFGVGTEAAAVAPPKSWFSSPHWILPCWGLPRRGGVEGRRTCGGGRGPPRSSSERRTGDPASDVSGGTRGRRALRLLGHLPTIRAGQSSASSPGAANLKCFDFSGGAVC